MKSSENEERATKEAKRKIWVSWSIIPCYLIAFRIRIKASHPKLWMLNHPTGKRNYPYAKFLSWGFEGSSHFSEPLQVTVKWFTMWPGCQSQFFATPFFILCQKINNVLLLHFLALESLGNSYFTSSSLSKLPQHLEMFLLCALLNPGLWILHLWDLGLWLLENMLDTDNIASSDGPWLLTQNPIPMLVMPQFLSKQLPVRRTHRSRGGFYGRDTHLRIP